MVEIIWKNENLIKICIFGLEFLIKTRWGNERGVLVECKKLGIKLDSLEPFDTVIINERKIK